MKTIKARVVMLPTENPKVESDDMFTSNGEYFTNGKDICTTDGDFSTQYHYLYVTTDEKIKVGDYITDGYKVWKWNDDSSLLGRRKVVATNDPKLVYNTEVSDTYFHSEMPQIQESFIKRYCEAGGIDDVEIEMELYKIKGFAGGEGYRIKINSDNTINIHSTKKSWTREDVEDILHRYEDDMFYGRDNYYRNVDTVREWIEENL